VEPAALVEKAKELRADAVLVSKVVTQRDVHKEDARNLIEAAKQARIFEKTIWLFGGPRVDHKTALELGFDAGFGPGTKPSDVANYIYYRLLERQNRAAPPEPTAHGTPDATIQGTEEPARNHEVRSTEHSKDVKA
jgi:beta-lysine 5,6-aminomutase beta subunit